MKYTGKLDDGRPFEFDPPVFSIEGTQVWPEIPLPPVTGVQSVDFSKTVISSSTKPNDTATTAPFRFKAVNPYSNGFVIVDNKGEKGLGVGIYSEKVEITRQDGKPFTLVEIKLFATYGISHPTGGTITALRSNGTTVQLALPSIPAGETAKVTINIADISKATLAYGKSNPTLMAMTYLPSGELPQAQVKWNGAISDTGTVDQLTPLMGELGFNAFRPWCGYDSKTGNLWNMNSINRANQFAAKGIKVMMVLHPSEQSSSVVFPQGAINSIIANLNKNVIVNIFNEVNSKDYWPNGNIAQAFEMASGVSKTLRTAGFKTGSPSFAYQHAPTITTWLNERKAAGQLNFDYIVGHNYPFWAGNWPSGSAQNFEEVVVAHKTVADSIGAGVLIDEWGFRPKCPESELEDLLPKFQATLDKYTVGNAYFILTKTGTAAQPRLPHDDYSWIKDFETGTVKQRVYNAFKALNR